MRILILGAGGQGQVLADALCFAAEAGQPVTPVGYLDDNPSLWQSAPLGLPVLGALAAWRDIDHGQHGVRAGCCPGQCAAPE